MTEKSHKHRTVAERIAIATMGWVLGYVGGRGDRPVWIDPSRHSSIACKEYDPENNVEQAWAAVKKSGLPIIIEHRPDEHGTYAYCPEHPRPRVMQGWPLAKMICAALIAALDAKEEP